jgi:hypothetical protein
MRAYDENKLTNIVLIEETADFLNADFITQEQAHSIKNNLPVFKAQNNLLLRSAFFILGSLLYASICGTISIIGAQSGESYFHFCFYIFAIIGWAGAEFLAQENYKNYGVDDAFVLGSILNLAIAIGINSESFELLIAFFVSISALLMYTRFVHNTSLLVFCLATTATLFYALLEIGTIGKTILPFATLIFAVGCYFFTKRKLTQLNELYYHKGLVIANSFYLILAYLSCNYFVVRELSAALLGMQLGPDQDIPFAVFFYFFTIAVPILYTMIALKTKDRYLLWIGALCIGFSIFTIRYYHSILPVEVAMTLGGIILFVIAYFSIQKLKDKTSGITFELDRLTQKKDLKSAEALVAVTAFGIKPETKIEESPMKFGGGDYSGGGASGSF